MLRAAVRRLVASKLERLRPRVTRGYFRSLQGAPKCQKCYWMHLFSMAMQMHPAKYIQTTDVDRAWWLPRSSADASALHAARTLGLYAASCAYVIDHAVCYGLWRMTEREIHVLVMDILHSTSTSLQPAIQSVVTAIWP